MANVKISDLPAAASAAGTDQLETNQSGTSRRLTVAQVATHVRSTATDTVVVAAGSASAPSIAPTGDSNTGLFFPSADTIAFSEGGVEVMRLDASGNVGIGAAPATRLHVVGGDGVTNTRLAGASFAVRVQSLVGIGAVLEATNNTEATYQPLIVGGSQVQFTTFGTERARITTGGDFQFNSGYGSVATAYACRAWVKFNGTGTVAINGSANVSSITDNGVGLYTVNFTTAMPDANYSVVATNSVVSGLNGSTTDTSASNGGRVYTCFMCVSQATPPTTTAVRVAQGSSFYAGDAYDPTQVHVAIFR